VGPLSDPENVRLISTNFVPVAVNLYKIRKDKGEAGDLFRAVQKQKDQYQGFWIVAPDSKVLSAHHEHSEKAWTQEVRAALCRGIAAFGPIAPRRPEWRDPLPLRGRGVYPDGSVDLAASMRFTYGGRPQGEGALDTIHLTAKQYSGFAPPEPAAGKGWSVPDEVTRQLSKCLTATSDQSVMPRPEEVKDVELIGNVRRVEDGVASLTFTGEISAVHKNPFLKGKINRASARIRGVGTYDVKGKRMLTLGLVLEGVFYMHAPYDREPQHVLAGVEWRRDPPADRKQGRR
jgi:hypothetical protein